MPPSERHVSLLVRLPRELRDMIYPYIVTEPDPVPLSDSHPQRESQAIMDTATFNDIIAAEALEAYYGCNTFILCFQPTKNAAPASLWGPHGELARTNIRHLLVKADEPVSKPYSTFADYETRYWYSADRQMWSQLLHVPKLTSLTVELQKWYHESLSWMDYAPIICLLRTQKAALDFKFTISFDDLLRKQFIRPTWRILPGSEDDEYDPMGCIDITDLFDKPSQEDQEYVKKYLPDKRMPKGRPVTAGLLDSNASDRRQLGHLYVVPEPQLFRVLIWEHFELCRDLDSKLREENSDDQRKEMEGLWSTNPDKGS
jgi:hypothetical protein